MSNAEQPLKILQIHIKKKWFDMILLYEKREEYREIKDHWISRLHKKHYDAVLLVNGYTSQSPAMLMAINGEITTGKPVKGWYEGEFDDSEKFIIPLGEIILPVGPFAFVSHFAKEAQYTWADKFEKIKANYKST